MYVMHSVGEVRVKIKTRALFVVTLERVKVKRGLNDNNCVRSNLVSHTVDS